MTAQPTLLLARSGAAEPPHSGPRPLCPGCFQTRPESQPCPRCKYDADAERLPFLLPHHSLLHGQYLIGRVLGEPGGFGITYLGFDQALNTRVAIKEYLPRDWAGRAPGQNSVQPHSEAQARWFRYGLDRFLLEARTLAQIDHQNVVRVRAYFGANGTAYLVMDYYQGLSLDEHRKRRGRRLPEAEALQLILPILDGLREVHAKGFLHRDIKPQNIYLAETDGGNLRPILIDFGAARQVMTGDPHTITVILTEGYAPIEQYDATGNQGPWTDIYSAAAVIYHLVTNKKPPASTVRAVQDTLEPAAGFEVSKALSRAVAAGLALAPEARPQSVEDFRALLTASLLRAGRRGSKPRLGVLVPWSLLILLTLFGSGYAIFGGRRITHGDSPTAVPAAGVEPAEPGGPVTGLRPAPAVSATTEAPKPDPALPQSIASPVAGSDRPEVDPPDVDPPGPDQSPGDQPEPASSLSSSIRRLPATEAPEPSGFVLEAEKNGRPFMLKTTRGSP